ncbi:MAG: hypothetical protein U0930_23850 [Pirellulales bacterium]
MTSKNYSERIQQYFDHMLDEQDLAQFRADLQTDSQLRQQFVEYSILHDRLHGNLQATQALAGDKLTQVQDSCQSIEAALSETQHPVARANQRSLQGWFIALTVAASIFVSFAVWRDRGNTAIAEQTELRRVIEANSANLLRSFELAVEAISPGDSKQKRVDQRENRPPKPPLDGAVLHVRGKNEFVMIRKTADGLPFVTGSDGKSSWAVRADGPVRVSDDLRRFNRDVPGHEFSVPLYNLHEALEHLQAAFELHVISESATAPTQTQRLLIAIKRKGFPGPKRVEITYEAESGLIDQLRFIDMPYGSDRLTVQLTLSVPPLATQDFFTHWPYHSADRKIEVE